MQKLTKSPRIRTIENQFGRSIRNFLYYWHWQENLKPREIAIEIYRGATTT